MIEPVAHAVDDVLLHQERRFAAKEFGGGDDDIALGADFALLGALLLKLLWREFLRVALIGRAGFRRGRCATPSRRAIRLVRALLRGCRTQ